MKYHRSTSNLHILLENNNIQEYRNWIMDKFAKAKMNYLIYDLESALKETSELAMSCTYPYDYEECTVFDNRGNKYNIVKLDPIIYENTTISLKEVEKLISAIMSRKNEIEPNSKTIATKATYSPSGRSGQSVTQVGQASTCPHCKGSGRCSCAACSGKMAVIEYQPGTKVCICIVCSGKGLNWIGPDKVDQSKKVDIKDNIPAEQRIVHEQIILKRIEAEERLIQKEIEKLHELQKTEQVIARIKEDCVKREAAELESVHNKKIQQQCELSERKIALYEKELNSELDRIREAYKVRANCENDLTDISLTRARSVKEFEIDPKLEIIEKELEKLDKCIEIEKIKASKPKKWIFGGN